MPAAIVGNASKSVGRQEEHLIFESIRSEWPSMAEYNRLAAAPVLVVDLRAVSGGNCVHRVFPLR